MPSDKMAKYGMTSNSFTVVSKNKYRRSSETANDVVVPKYKERSANGEVFNNPYQKFIKNISVSGTANFNYSNIDGVTDVETDNGWFMLDYYNSLIYNGPLPSIVYPDEVNLARNAQIQCHGSVNQTEFDSLTFASEWSKTKILHRQVGSALLKLFLDPKTGLLFANKLQYRKARVKRTPLFDSLGQPMLNRKGKPIYKYSHTKESVSGKPSFHTDVANAYLVGRYGVGPLLHDLEDALKSLTRSKALRKTARGTYTVNATTSTPLPGPMLRGFLPIPGNILRVGARTVRYGIFYETSAFMSGAASYGFTRPLSTVWELIPYSFVFDWLINVGGWLDAIQPSGASRTLSAWASTRTSEFSTLTVSGSGGDIRPQYADRYTYSASASMVVSEISFNRNLWDATIPKFPGLGTGLNPLRSFDFMTLVVQKIRSH